MTKQNDNKPTNFWFGFTLGTLTAGAAAYLLCTKKGRDILKRLIDTAENLPEAIPLLIDEVYTKNDMFQKQEVSQKIIGGLNAMDEIINKIKHNSTDKDKKKFFIKEVKQ